MAVQIPTPQQVREAATEVGLSLTDADVQSYIGLMKGNIAAYNLVDAMPDNLPAVKYPRTPGYFPPPEENKHNAWYVKTSIKGAESGPLCLAVTEVLRRRGLADSAQTQCRTQLRENANICKGRPQNLFNPIETVIQCVGMD